ncbi:unnamed protein product [Rhizoctonia solani]|nr:unnamed protein product [Rhizoctonia solani]
MLNMRDSEYDSEGSNRNYESTRSRPSKRTRTNTSGEKPPRKKYIKGKQGGLEGIMKMPIEVFAEITYYLNPADLISLIQTNKFFRSMLLNRSAILIWQSSLSNVPDLPPCPNGMVEPQYAALIFSKNCTICGSSVSAAIKPDPYLRVRLCTSCRDSELEKMEADDLDNYIPFTTIIKAKRSGSKTPAYHLRTQKAEFDHTREDFINKSDMKGLAAWRLHQLACWETQRQEGDHLLKYLNSVAASRSDELKDLKLERKERIHERLRALGWEDRYFNSRGSSNGFIKQWGSLVEVAKPLTERTWANLLPKLTQLLKKNRRSVDLYERQQRREKRQYTIDGLLREFVRNTNPYRPIIDALELESSAALESHSINSVTLLPISFPRREVIIQWDVLTSLYKEENSLERVKELFNERQAMVSHKLLEWRTNVEDQLVKRYHTSPFPNDNSSPFNATLTIKGNIDVTKNLSDSARFLLRADTVFNGRDASNIHFPKLRYLTNTPRLSRPTLEWLDIHPLHGYTRYAKGETIAKALLKELHMPDAAFVELVSMGKVFICGMCSRGSPMDWNTLTEHYCIRSDCKHIEAARTRHPIVFRNTHNLDTRTTSRPLVRVCSSEEADQAFPFNPVVNCLLCHSDYPWGEYRFDSLALMRWHMGEVHEVMEPVDGVHFLNNDDFKLWDKFKFGGKWDEYHDALKVDEEGTKA